MKYFILNKNLNPQEVGMHPHASKLAPNQEYSVTEDYSFWNIRPFVKLENIRIPKFIFNYKSKKNDLISIVGIQNADLVISDKLDSLFDKFELPLFEKNDLIIAKKEKAIEYKFIHFIEPLDTQINFEKSEFNVVQGSTKVQEIQFFNFADFEDKHSKLLLANRVSNQLSMSYRPKKIVFFDNLKFDLFAFKSILGLIIINEKLANALITNKITGVDILPIEDYKKIEFVLSTIS